MDVDGMSEGRMGLNQVHTKEGNVEGKCVKVSRKLTKPDLLEFKPSESSKSDVPDSGQTSELVLSGNNGRMQWDGMGTEDGMSRMELLVGTVQDEGRMNECSVKLSGKIVKT